jgi:hypothetical protein
MFFIVLAGSLLFIETDAYCQNMTATSIKLGYFKPKDASSGLLLGFNYAYVIDETVDVGFGADFFRKNYQRDSEVAQTVYEQNVTETTKQRDLEFTTMILPIMATINLKIPISSYTPISYVLSGGLGWEMMFNTEQNYQTDQKSSRFYHGFGYNVSAGILYQIGSRSALLAEVGYNGCKVSRNHKVEQGLPVWDEVNISGLLLRVGVRLGVL